MGDGTTDKTETKKVTIDDQALVKEPVLSTQEEVNEFNKWYEEQVTKKTRKNPKPMLRNQNTSKQSSSQDVIKKETANSDISHEAVPDESVAKAPASDFNVETVVVLVFAMLNMVNSYRLPEFSYSPHLSDISYLNQICPLSTDPIPVQKCIHTYSTKRLLSTSSSPAWRAGMPIFSSVKNLYSGLERRFWRQGNGQKVI